MNYKNINKKATDHINKMWLDKDIRTCEFSLPECIGTSMGLHNCHRHKRRDYKTWGKTEDEMVKILSDFNQVMRGCPVCDTTTENDRDKLEKHFLSKRGEDNLEELKK